jgi:hypothetical protein
MNDLLVIVAIFAGWYVLNKFVLPRLGVKT